MPPKPLRTIAASPRVVSLLDKLHQQSQAQESTLSMYAFWIGYLLKSFFLGNFWSQKNDDYMRDKFIALEREKCEFIYLLARATGARNIVEAGTSFGVSTTYLALAAGQNAQTQPGECDTKVVATEKEPNKAAKAREHWKDAGEEVEPYITLLEGDLLDTLPVELDIWTPLALPTLQLVQPKLRPGAVIITDLTQVAKGLYKELLEYIYDPKNGFRTMTTPFNGGLEVTVYLPE
ncbi:O-methyltransferase [Aspergillus alliaceus]|uniref:O-methyltransferase n=1 Tax=Petromyces alliaceus TaxID=209559 RepID=UPI0012A5105B|nr:S-adenosyl-L-methionine-dependent methyltransferase [Aspergillus alliaceus]KAB8235877.1 S-adenosyl-L-methionine-dependent methyltransferase [Aspergillus alliaceus]